MLEEGRKFEEKKKECLRENKSTDVCDMSRYDSQVFSFVGGRENFFEKKQEFLRENKSNGSVTCLIMTHMHDVSFVGERREIQKEKQECF